MGTYLLKIRFAFVAAILLLLPFISRAQSPVSEKVSGASDSAQQGTTGTQANPPAANSQPAATPPAQQPADSDETQTKRILWVIPNFRSVSASTKLPPLSVKEKFVLATQDSFDYSGFLLAGMIAGYSMAVKSTPEFHQGAAGYGRYYYHSFLDETSGNYFTEAIVPSLTHQDPRYYTLGHGGFWRRSGYAVTRLIITRTDSGGSTFNVSEIAGNLAGAGLANVYYPAQERTFRKTAENWGTQVGVDGIADFLKEFWPDIRHTLFHQ
jgi:hypothetical protein